MEQVKFTNDTYRSLGNDTIYKFQVNLKMMMLTDGIVRRHPTDK